LTLQPVDSPLQLFGAVVLIFFVTGALGDLAGALLRWIFKKEER
jgi:hypothetical protein